MRTFRFLEANFILEMASLKYSWVLGLGTTFRLVYFGALYFVPDA